MIKWKTFHHSKSLVFVFPFIFIAFSFYDSPFAYAKCTWGKQGSLWGFLFCFVLPELWKECKNYTTQSKAWVCGIINWNFEEASRKEFLISFV